MNLPDNSFDKHRWPSVLGIRFEPAEPNITIATNCARGAQVAGFLSTRPRLFRRPRMMTARCAIRSGVQFLPAQSGSSRGRGRIIAGPTALNLTA